MRVAKWTSRGSTHLGNADNRQRERERKREWASAEWGDRRLYVELTKLGFDRGSAFVGRGKERKERIKKERLKGRQRKRKDKREEERGTRNEMGGMGKWGKLI